MAFDIAPYIDHTILKPGTTAADIKALCTEAVEHGFAAVCIPPYYVKIAKKYLQDSPVKLTTVIGFPLGYMAIDSKIAEITKAIADGADELDIVHNIAALKNGDWGYLEKEVMECLIPAHQYHKTVKVIIESGLLTDEEIIKCCELYCEFNIDFLKTSTGFAETGATVHAVELMRKHLPEKIAIKASGGIRNFKFAKELIDAGATRIGCSASLQLIQESKGSI
jgi:deoxyribose-phosphate aldolase